MAAVIIFFLYTLIFKIAESIYRPTGRVTRREIRSNPLLGIFRYSLEDSAVSPDGLVRHGTEQLLEGIRSRKAAVFSEIVKNRT